MALVGNSKHNTGMLPLAMPTVQKNGTPALYESLFVKEYMGKIFGSDLELPAQLRLVCRLKPDDVEPDKHDRVLLPMAIRYGGSLSTLVNDNNAVYTLTDCIDS